MNHVVLYCPILIQRVKRRTNTQPHSTHTLVGWLDWYGRESVMMASWVYCCWTALAVIWWTATAVHAAGQHGASSEGSLDAVEHRCVHDHPDWHLPLHHVTQQMDRTVPQQYGDGTIPAATSSSTPPPAPVRRSGNTLAAGVFQPIRITLSWLDVDNPNVSCQVASGTAPDFTGNMVACTAEAVLTDAKKALLKQVLVPSAVAMHQMRLSVPPIVGNLTLASVGQCPYFTIPSSHVSSGVPNTDFVLYIAAGPTSSANLMAWASTCAVDQLGRPIAGRMNFNPKYIANNSDSALQTLIRVAAHEITHALGFSSSLLLSPSASVPLVSSRSVRGKPDSIVATSPTVVAAAQKYFNCSNLSFVEIEDEGGSGTVASHWKRRNHYDELMVGVSYTNYYSNLTLALLHDSGLYRGNFTPSADDAKLQFARGAGCALIDSPCLVNGVAANAKLSDTFCSDMTGTDMCTFDRLAIGACRIGNYSGDLPSYEQYFSAMPSLGGTSALMDYCPVVLGYSNMLCANPSIDRSVYQVFGGSFGASSRCVSVDNLVQNGYQSPQLTAMCMVARCPRRADTGSLRLQLFLSAVPGQWMDCPLNGMAGILTNLSGYDGSVWCPKAADVCFDQSLWVLDTWNTTATPTTAAVSVTTSAPTTAPVTSATLTTTTVPVTASAPTTTSSAPALSTTTGSQMNTSTTAGVTVSTSSTTTAGPAATGSSTTAAVQPTTPTTLQATTGAPMATSPTPTSTLCDCSASLVVAVNQSSNLTLVALQLAAAIASSISASSGSWTIAIVSSNTSHASFLITFVSSSQRDAAVVQAKNKTVFPSIVSCAAATLSTPSTSPAPPVVITSTAAPPPAGNSTACDMCLSSMSIGILSGVVSVIALTIIVICVYKRYLQRELEERAKKRDAECEEMRSRAVTSQPAGTSSTVRQNYQDDFDDFDDIL